MVTVRTRSLDALEATMIIGHYTVWKKSIFHQEVCIYIYVLLYIQNVYLGPLSHLMKVPVVFPSSPLTTAFLFFKVRIAPERIEETIQSEIAAFKQPTYCLQRLAYTSSLMWSCIWYETFGKLAKS